MALFHYGLLVGLVLFVARLRLLRILCYLFVCVCVDSQLVALTAVLENDASIFESNKPCARHFQAKPHCARPVSIKTPIKLFFNLMYLLIKLIRTCNKLSSYLIKQPANKQEANKQTNKRASQQQQHHHQQQQQQQRQQQQQKHKATTATTTNNDSSSRSSNKNKKQW